MLRRKHADLQSLEPNLAGPAPHYEGDRYADHWRKQYTEIFQTIPTSHESLQAAVLREAACMKPAKPDPTKKSGGRDVAIWFSLLEYLEKNPTKSIFFVSANTSDFGEPDEWPFPLDIDLGGKSSRITHLLSFEDVLDRFSEQSTASETIREDLLTRLNRPEVTGAIHRSIWKKRILPFFDSRHPHSAVHMRMEPHITGDIECRSIQTSKWYWTKVTWQLCAMPEDAEGPLVASWDTSILFSGEDGDVSILRSGRLTEIAADDLTQEMQAHLSSIMEDEAVRLDDETFPTGNQEHSPTPHTGTPKRPYLKPIVHSGSEESAFAYERAVLEALRRIAGRVEYAGSLNRGGIDALVVTPEGIIGVAIKYGHAPRTFENATAPSLRHPAVPTDALLTVTSEYSRGQNPLFAHSHRPTSRPHETVRRVGRTDDARLAKSIRIIRHKLTPTDL